jgi:dTDP-glucose 4,6-dehydratase
MSLLVTGGAGFIGSNFVLDWLAQSEEPVVNLDALTYAGQLRNLESLHGDERQQFVRGDICDRALLDRLLDEHRPRAVVHFAAESHVDRSIDCAAEFMRTNVLGSYTLLEASLAFWRSVPTADARAAFRFLHVSTDEVYGSLAPDAPAFTESHAYRPNSPYAASKAAGDHLVRAWHHTYGLPALTTHCSNNYGPRQLPEKFVPRLIACALAGERLPVYGDGQQVRDWLYVHDHTSAIRHVLDRGRPGEVYNIGAKCERANLDIVRTVCRLLDELQPDPAGSYRRLITHVTDRPGHDRRYAVDVRKVESELQWRAAEALDDGLRKTVGWYLSHPQWLAVPTDRAAGEPGRP